MNHPHGHTLPDTTLFRSTVRSNATDSREVISVRKRRPRSVSISRGSTSGSSSQPAAPETVPQCRVMTAAKSTSLPGKRSEEHTSELQSLMRISYAVFCLKKKNKETSTNISPLKTQH